MANLLKMALVESIFTLHQRGWSQRRIARELGLNRETVARHLRQAAAPKPAIAPLGSAEPARDAKPATLCDALPAPADGSKPAIAPIGSEGLAEAPVPRRGVGR